MSHVCHTNRPTSSGESGSRSGEGGEEEGQLRGNASVGFMARCVWAAKGSIRVLESSPGTKPNRYALSGL